MQGLALLVALLLPLHGVANAVASIQSPAHYHLQSQAFAPASTPYQPLHDDDVLVSLDDRADSANQTREALIGHHAHALDQTGVVYVDGDSDPSDPGGAGKHAKASGEAPLPGWAMPLLASRFTQTLPEPDEHYRSQPATPLLRPPSATGASIA